MKIKTIKIISYITIWVIFLILFIMISLNHISIYGEALYLDDTINKYKQNDVLFKNSIREIQKESNDIYFDMIENELSVKIHINTPEIKSNISIIELKKEEFINYENTISLMKKLNIKRISKIDGNIEFVYKKSYGNILCIAYLNEIKKYMLAHDVIKIKEIDSLELEEIDYYKENISIDYVIRNSNSDDN